MWRSECAPFPEKQSDMQRRVQGGSNLGQLSPQTSVATTIEWRLFAINASFLVSMEVKTDIKKYSKINDAFHMSG